MTNQAAAAKIAAAAAIAEFLARKSVTKVATGASSGISDREFFLASRGDIDLTIDRSERIAERQLEAGREARHCGADFNEALWAARHAGDMAR